LIYFLALSFSERPNEDVSSIESLEYKSEFSSLKFS